MTKGKTMNVETKINQNHDKQTELSKIQLKEEDTAILANTNMPFANVLAGQISEDSTNTINSNLSMLPIDYNFDSINISFEDAMFFVNLTKEAQFSVETTQNGNFQNLIQTQATQNIVSQRTVEVTNQIASLIEKAQSTQKPVRITFDNDVSVILKIDKNGKVTAEFIPGSLEVENFLRNNIASLRQKFDEQNLPYNDLLYRQNNGQNNRNKNKKEEKK